jgi:hypothetical protein
LLRLLDVDLDFFVHGAAHWRDRGHGRLDASDYPAWSVDEALDVLYARCGLIGRLPGFVVEHHAELFDRWRDGIAAGVLHPPFHVTHVDAHADLGLGDAGYLHLMTSLLFEAPERRREPGDALADGNFLAFAIACRWVAELDYVFNEEGGNDVMPYVMEGFNADAAHIQLAALTPSQIDELLHLGKPQPVRLEPRVPFRAMPCHQFSAESAFDVVCIARSPAFTPATSDVIFDAIRERFIDEVTQ